MAHEAPGFEDSIESLEKIFNSEVPSPRALRQLSMRALLGANRTESLRRSKNGKSLIWTNTVASLDQYERGSYLFSHNPDTDVSRLHFRSLAQDFDIVPDDDGYSTSGGWRGVLDVYELSWNKSETLEAHRTSSIIPTFTSNEREIVHDLILMRQVTEDNVGEEDYRDLKEIEGFEPTPTSGRSLVSSYDLARIEDKFSRLNGAR